MKKCSVAQQMVTALEVDAKSELHFCCQTLCNKLKVKNYIEALEQLVKEQQEEINRLKGEYNE